MSKISPVRAVCYFLLVGGALATDLWSKNTVFERLGSPFGGTDWLTDGWFKFRLYTVFNHGALWGVGQGMSWLFATLSIAAVVGILIWLFWGGAVRSWWLTVALGLITGGTLGNLWDRSGMHGETSADGQPIFAVRDFLHCRLGTFDWAIFNMADVFLVTGAIMLAVHSFTTSEERKSNSFTDVTADQPGVSANA